MAAIWKLFIFVSLITFATNKVQLTNVDSITNKTAFVAQQNVYNQQPRNDSESIIGNVIAEGNGQFITRCDSDDDDEILEAMNKTIGANLTVVQNDDDSDKDDEILEAVNKTIGGNFSPFN
eukprot:455597_1